VSLESDGSCLKLTIQNDGQNIPGSASTAKGMGLRIMQHRASLINANLSFKPADGGGTIVTCVLNTNEVK